MNTTTIRVDVPTHRRIQIIHEATGKPMMEIVREAVDALDRVRFAATVASELHELQSQPEAWAHYLAEADGLPSGDGLT